MQRVARPPSSPDPLRVRIDEFELDEANARLTRGGRAVALAPTPFAVLCALARLPGSLLTKDALLDAVWGHQFVSDSVLKTAISDLRTVLGDDPRKPRFIETVSRRGYRFIAPATAVHSAVRASGSAVRARTSSFVGRTNALARLQQAWESACSGKRCVVWVAGEPGIGKTTLIEHFIASLGDIACARGHCVEHYGSGESYLPVLEALGGLSRDDAQLPALLRAVAPTWLLQLPWLSTGDERDALRRELAGMGAERMLRELGELLDRYTEQRPLLLVTEDLHWSDRATIQLIDYLARRRGNARLMWLASFRLAEVVALDHSLSALRHELRVHGLCEEIVLDPFSETEVADYVAERSSSLAGDETFVRSLHGRTDGVPLFVASVLSEAMEHSARTGDDAAAATHLDSGAVPEKLGAIIDHYIARLADEHRELLSAAAVCGVEFRVGTVAHVLGRDAACVGKACDALAREQFWLAAAREAQGGDAPDLPYSFRHALFRQVAYERTPPSTRAQIHAKVGAALEWEHAAGVPVAAAELAMHFDRGRQPMAALRHYCEAAQVALQQLSPASCLSLTERAAAVVAQSPQGPERHALEIALFTLRGVSAVHALGAGDEARDSFQRAYALLGGEPHPMSGLLLHGLGLVLCMRAEYAAALEVAERASAFSSDSGDPLLVLAACMVHTDVDQLQGRPGAARAWAERGLDAARPLAGAPDITYVADPQVTLLGMLAITLVHLGLLDQASARLEQAQERAGALRQPMTRLVALWYQALFEVRLEDAERVALVADQMGALVEEFGLAQGRTACSWFRGWAEARRGQPLEGYRLIRRGYDENERIGMRAGSSEVLGYGAEALLRAGDCDAAQRELDEAFRVAEARVERVYQAQLLLIESRIARARGNDRAADVSVRRAIAEARRQEAAWYEWRALAELGEHGGATAEDLQALAALADRLAPARAFMADRQTLVVR